MLVSQVKRTLTAGAGVAALMSATTASAEWGLNLTPGVTSISQTAYDLHMLILWICVAIGVVVFGAMFISIFKHRKSKGAQPAQFHESTAVEIVWTIVPFLILVGMAIPATKALIAMEDTSDADLRIKVTAYQWRWGYEYMDEGVSLVSTLSTPRDQIYGKVAQGEDYLLEVDNPVVVPVNKKVRLLITSSDVIHAWWVPKFGMKKDAIPGFINEMWFNVQEEGVYRGQCAELCGKDHGFMPIVVIAKNEADYQRWLAEQRSAQTADAAAAMREWSRDELMAHGEKVYNTACATCHQQEGVGIPGTFPAINGSPVANGPKPEHLQLVMNGKPDTLMTAYAEQLNDTDIAAVVTYQRNAWDNDTGDLVQPSEVKAAR